MSRLLHRLGRSTAAHPCRTISVWVLLAGAIFALAADPALMGTLRPLDRAVAPTRPAGLQVELGGDLPDTAAAPIKGRGELIGIIAALLILVLAFGSVVGSGLPVAVALVGLGVG